MYILGDSGVIHVVIHLNTWFTCISDSFRPSVLLPARRRNYFLLSDVLEHLGISRGALIKKAKRLDIREMPWSQFMAEIADRPLCVVPKHTPADSSTHEAMVELVPINYNLRRLLNIRVESVHMTWNQEASTISEPKSGAKGHLSAL